MTFLGPLKSHRALHLWYWELLNVRPKERCILFLCANYLKSNKARKCVISADINAGIHPLHHSVRTFNESFKCTSPEICDCCYFGFEISYKEWCHRMSDGNFISRENFVNFIKIGDF